MSTTADDSSSVTALDLAQLIIPDIAHACRTDSNLVYTNSRRFCELVSAKLHRYVDEQQSDHDPFVSHHGNLDREVRHATEQRLKGGRGATAVATSSLELGLDIGDARSVLQVNPPWKVSSLRQRLGRSGRRDGQPAILRQYVLEDPVTATSSLARSLHPKLVRGVSMIELMLRGWVESAREPGYHLSTFVHQGVSIVRQRGAIPPDELFHILCINGPFRRVDSVMFDAVCSRLCQKELLDTESDGVLVLGRRGEAITGHWEFYAAFRSEDEFSVRCAGETIGGLQTQNLPDPGECIVLNGRKWLIESIDGGSKTVHVTPAPAGLAPHFAGDAGEIDDAIYREMRNVLQSEAIPSYLDPGARQLLAAAREQARRAKLDCLSLIVGRDTIQWFPWIGSRGFRTLRLHAQHAGFGYLVNPSKPDSCGNREFLSIQYSLLDRGRFVEHLQQIASMEVSPVILASYLIPKAFGKLDGILTNDLLDQANAIERLNPVVAAEAANVALAELAANA